MAAEDWNMFDDVKRPFHYEGDGEISAMDAMRSMMSATSEDAIVNYWWGCAFKYIWRWPHKGGTKDIDKAIQCLRYLKAEVEKARGSMEESGEWKDSHGY